MIVTSQKNSVLSKRKDDKIEKNKRVTICQICKGVHYRGVYYAPDSRFALLLDRNNSLISYHTCPACQMQKEGLYEGVLYVKDIPHDLYDQVVATIFHEAVQDYTDNPQHRLLEFTNTIDGYRVTATAATMVRRLGQKIQSVFGTCEARCTYHRDPYPLPINEEILVVSEFF